MPRTAIRLLLASILSGALATENRAADSASRHGITWTFSRPATVGAYANGDPWVVGPVEIVAISPPPAEGRHGTMVNPEIGIRQGFDKDFNPDYNPYDTALNVGKALPLSVAPDSSVVSSITADAWTQYDTIQSFAILTVVQRPPAEGSFRPSAIGPGSRESRWRESQLDYSKLATVPRAQLTAAPPLADSVEWFGHPWLELNPNWTGLFLRPSYMARNGYGRELAYRTGDACLLLNLDYTPAQKRDLLVGVVQVGLDNFAFIVHGGVWYNDGGHNLGRLAPLIVAAGALNDDALKAALKGSALKFQEFQNTFFVTQADVDRVQGVWNHELNRLAGTNGDPLHPYAAADIGLPEWGIRHTGYPELDSNSPLASYRDINGSAYTAPALVATAMGLRTVVDWEPLFQYAERHVSYELGPDYKGEWNSNPTPLFHRQFRGAYRDAVAVGASVERPTLDSTGPRASTDANAVYKKVADGDWRMADGATPAPFRFANGDRDIIVEPGDHLIFRRATFNGHVNVGPVWNFHNDNMTATEVVFEDCILAGGLGVSTVGKMHVTLANTRIDGYTGFAPSPDSLITVSNVSIIAAHGGDAARIGRPNNQGNFPFGSDSRTPVVMRNSLIKTTGPSNPGDHRDAMQVLGGSGIAFTNVVFDLNSGEYPGLGDGQNVSLFIEDATNGSVSDIDIVDCWVLGSGSYFRMGIQHRSGARSRNINLVRPRIERGAAPLYGSDFSAFQTGVYRIERPVYGDDMSPVPLSLFGL